MEDGIRRTVFFRHIGLYGFRTETLLELTKLAPSRLELAESLEQLRWLENGYSIQVQLTDRETIGIDTPEDLEAALAATTDAARQIHTVCVEQRVKRLNGPVTPGRSRQWGIERSPNRVRRGDPCPCGSKLDFRLCHGKVRK